MNHYLDTINKRLIDGYYRNLPPYSYSKDVANVLYDTGQMTKAEYDLIISKYEFYSNKEYESKRNDKKGINNP